MSLDAVAKRYARTPTELLALPIEELDLILGVYYYARGEEAKDEWYRKLKQPKG